MDIRIKVDTEKISDIKNCMVEEMYALESGLAEMADILIASDRFLNCADSETIIKEASLIKSVCNDKCLRAQQKIGTLETIAYEYDKAEKENTDNVSTLDRGTI